MKQHTATTYFPLKTITVMAVILSVVGIMTTAFRARVPEIRATETGKIKKDSVASVQAFMDVYKVLMSPRCMNCHPAGEAPLQGDDSHIHIMNVQRGKDGKGLYAAKCSNCHQPANTPGEHTPPGNPKWQLPPGDMKMVFQGKTARQLAMQIMDYNQNGHKNKEQLLEHAHDTLVKAAWNMGEGRTPPPLTHEEFVTVWNKWIETGGYAPAE